MKQPCIVKAFVSENVKAKLQAFCEAEGVTEAEYIRAALMAKFRADSRKPKVKP